MLNLSTDKKFYQFCAVVFNLNLFILFKKIMANFFFLTKSSNIYKIRKAELEMPSNKQNITSRRGITIIISITLAYIRVRRRVYCMQIFPSSTYLMCVNMWRYAYKMLLTCLTEFLQFSRSLFRLSFYLKFKTWSWSFFAEGDSVFTFLLIEKACYLIMLID